jgi:flagellar biosynthetic protein FlhB
MSEQDQAQEKSLRPSPRRLDKARREVQVARSRELNTVNVMLAGGSTYLLFGAWAIGGLGDRLRLGLTQAAEIVHEPASIAVVMSLMTTAIGDSLRLLAPVMIGAMVAAIAGPVLLGGFTLSAEALRPKFSRLSPLGGLKRIVSLQGLMELAKTLLKFAVLTSLAALLLWSLRDQILALGIGSPGAAIIESGRIVRAAFITVALGLVLIAAIDVPFQIYSHVKKLMMTQQEMRDEHKETEGSPETRARVRRVRQEIASRRMMADVPLADVVLTNPTEYAVAIRYTDRPDRAPRVVAKGRGLIAARIREIAGDNKVPVCEAPLLARAVYFNTDIGAEIPASLFLAVARVLVWVMNLKTARQAARPAPAFPSDLPVPPEMVTEPGYAS